MSYSTQSTYVSPTGAVQWTCQQDLAIYDKMIALGNGSQRANYVEVYRQAEDSHDYDILKGEICMMLSPEFAPLGGGHHVTGISNVISQQPMVFTSLNTFKLELKRFANPAKITEEEKMKIMKRAIRIAGVSVKTHFYKPGAVHGKDAPIVHTFGPDTLVNISKDDIAVGDLIYARFPGRDESPTIIDHRNGLSRTKRVLIPTPYKGNGPASMLTMRQAFKTDAKGNAALSAAQRHREQPVLDDDDSYLAKSILDLAKYIAFVTLCCENHRQVNVLNRPALFQGGEDEILRQVGLSRYDSELVPSADQLATRRFSEQPNGAAAPLEMDFGRYLQYALTLPCKDKRFLLTEPNQRRIGGIVENAIGALSLALAEDKSKIFARAMRSAQPGMRFDVQIGLVGSL
jgi:hypothetical protein